MDVKENQLFGLLEEIATRNGMPYGYNERDARKDQANYTPDGGVANFIPDTESTHGRNLPHLEFRPRENAVVISRMQASDAQTLSGRLIARGLKVRKLTSGEPMAITISSGQDMRKLGEEMDKVFLSPSAAKGL
jgi:hypothetical protein